MDLNKIKNKLKKTYGSLKMGNELQDTYEYISTGNLAFDLISEGGVPFGHSVEFLGLSQSGKSTLVLQLIANAQKDYNAIGILVDRENSYYKPRGEQLGINNNNLLIAPPQDTVLVTNAFNFLMDTIDTIRAEDTKIWKEKTEGTKTKDDLLPFEYKTYIVIAIDSIAAFDQDTALEKSNTPRKAKELHAGFRKILPYLDDHIILLIANQVTYKIVMFGDPKTSTAGESMKYYNHVRFSLEDRSEIKDPKKGNEVLGNWLKMEVIKTRTGPSHRVCYVRHLYETGIDYYSGYARLLAQRGILKPKNEKEFNSFKQSTLKYEDNEINEDKMRETIEKYPELLLSEYPKYGELSLIKEKEEVKENESNTNK